jgi:hypothetical protein
MRVIFMETSDGVAAGERKSGAQCSASTRLFQAGFDLLEDGFAQ